MESILTGKSVLDKAHQIVAAFPVWQNLHSKEYYSRETLLLQFKYPYGQY